LRWDIGGVFKSENRGEGLVGTRHPGARWKALQCDEDKCLVGQLQRAAAAWGSVGRTFGLVVVLGGEDEGCEPEIGEDEVEWQIV
jgi:hypothetical protein